MIAQAPNRDPGESIKEILRQEVNFGCPVCGSPFLAYHHFDPPWAGNHQHNVSGMIALCIQCHAQADGHRWTNAQLKEMKRNPFINDAIRVPWPYSAEQLILKVGPCLVVGSGSALRLNGRVIMHFKPALVRQLDMRAVVFNSEIKDLTGKTWFRIQDNYLDLDVAEALDVSFSPQAKHIVAKRRDESKIDLRYKKVKVNELENWLKTFVTPNRGARDSGHFKPQLAKNYFDAIVKAGCVDSDEDVPIMEISGRFRTPEMKVSVTSRKLTVEFSKSFLGKPETVQFSSHCVNDVNRIILKYDPSRFGGAEFFGIG